MSAECLTILPVVVSESSASTSCEQSLLTDQLVYSELNNTVVWDADDAFGTIIAHLYSCCFNAHSSYLISEMWFYLT